MSWITLERLLLQHVFYCYKWKFPFDTEDKNLHDNEGNIDLEKVLPILRQVKALSRSQRFDLKYDPKDKDFDAKIRRKFKQYYANPWKLPEPDYCGGVMLAPDGEYYEIPKVTVRYILAIITMLTMTMNQ